MIFKKPCIITCAIKYTMVLYLKIAVKIRIKHSINDLSFFLNYSKIYNRGGCMCFCAMCGCVCACVSYISLPLKNIIYNENSYFIILHCCWRHWRQEKLILQKINQSLSIPQVVMMAAISLLSFTDGASTHFSRGLMFVCG